MTRYAPRPLPPKRPVDSSGRDIYEQAARASWIAPLIAIGIGFCMSLPPSGGFSVAMVRLILDIIMIVGGLAMGIFALTGVRKRGPERVLAPAIVGLIINGLIILATVSLLAGGGLSRAKTTAALQGKTDQQIGEETMQQAGWFGALRQRGALITATSMAPSTPMGQLVGSETANVGHMVLIAIDNSSGASSMDVDTNSLTIYAPGRTFKAMGVSEVPSSDKPLRQGMSRFGGTRQVPAGGILKDGVAFFATNLDLTTAQKLTLTIDGQQVTIPGRFYTSQEKAGLLEKGRR